jgi:carbamoyl-phosphate synthase large subunit
VSDNTFLRAFAGRRVLVTGGAGVIAGELLRQLSAAGADTLSVDRLPLASPPPGVRHLVADLADADLAPLAEFRPQHLFHLAATFERSVETPEFWEQNWRDNVVVTHRMAELGDGLGSLEAFVFASSYLIYDPRQYSTPTAPVQAVMLSEQAPIGTRNLTGAAKLYGEAEVRFMREARQARFRTVDARIFRVYGRGSRDVVSRWVRAALAGEPIELYHGENRFDYIFSGDVAEGLLRLAANDGASGTFNLGRGEAQPVNAVIEAVNRATGSRLDVRVAEVDEPFEASCADLGRLRGVLGWAPTIALPDGVELLVAHERSRRQAATGA